MIDRKPLDDMTSDDLDQLHDRLARALALHEPTGVVAAAEHGLPPDCTAGCGDWPCATYNALTAEPGPV
ncbi:hypothetical protein ACJWDR_29005 [Streptomyces tauricus]|uniref:hypothetical protein n=1 Tax=Streptomyces tauricus TaxID=68274 RepID=UPI00387F1523